MRVALPVALAVILVPGIGFALLAYRPGEVTLPTRLALTFVLGCCVAGSVTFGLSIARALWPATFFSLLAAATIGGWVAALRRASLPEHGRALAEELRRDFGPVVIGLLVVAGMATIWFFSSSLLHVRNSTSWRYWADALEIADAGHVPSRVLQFGAALPSVVNKVFLNTLNAGMTFAIGSEPLPGLRAMQWIGSIGLALVLWALGKELGLQRLAILLPILLVANRFFLGSEMTTDLDTYKAETFGRMVGFAGVAVGVRAIRDRRGPMEPILAGVLLSVTAGIHAVPVIIAVLMLAGYALGRVIADRALLDVIRTSLLMAVVFLGAAVTILFLPRGDLGLKGAASDKAYPEFAANFDPTLYLSAGIPPGTTQVGSSLEYRISPGDALRRYVLAASDAPEPLRRGLPSNALILGVSVGGVLAAAAILWRFPRDLKPVGLMALTLGAAIAALIWFFSVRYSLYIPARFGVRRLLDYGSIPIVIVLLALAEGGLLLLSRVSTRVALALAVVLTLAVAASLASGARAPRPHRTTQAILEGYEWIRSNTPCEARVLPSQHTEGVFEALLGRPSVTEGATPYLRPQVIQPIVEVLLAARAFFEDPRAHRSFLDERGIDYVVALGARIGYPQTIGRIRQAQLDDSPWLQRVFSNKAMTIYRVTTSSSPTGLPNASGFPGYRCLRAAIAA